MLGLCFKCISGSNLAVLKLHLYKVLFLITIYELLTTEGNRSEREAERKVNVSVVFFIQENNKDCPEQSLCDTK